MFYSALRADFIKKRRDELTPALFLSQKKENPYSPFMSMTFAF